MPALVKACQVANSIRNTGKECDVSMGPTAMLIAVPPDYTFNDTDLADIDTWITTLIHAPLGQRGYPFFGNSAPIRFITNNKENDVLVTLDDGSTEFLRYGFFNRTFQTTSGGICYAKALQSLNKSGYNVIEVDKSGQVLCHDNGDGTYKGLVTDFMYSPSPDLADLKNTTYRNAFYMSYSPEEYVQYGVILSGGISLLNYMGLIDVVPAQAGAATVAHLLVTVKTECAGTNLVSLLGDVWNDVTNFIIKKKSDGTVITPTGVTRSGNTLTIAGTFVAATPYNVYVAGADALLANDIEGYDGVDFVTIQF